MKLCPAVSGTDCVRTNEEWIDTLGRRLQAPLLVCEI